MVKGRGWLSKDVSHHGWPTTKKKHWLKRPKAVAKYKIWTKISFFENIVLGISVFIFDHMFR